MVFGNKHLAYNISHATIARNLFVRNGAGQTSSDHGEIALCEPGSTGTIEDNTFFAVDTDPEFVYYETRGPGAVLSSGAWYVNNNTIYGHGEVKNMIAPTVILSHGCSQIASLVHKTVSLTRVKLTDCSSTSFEFWLLFAYDQCAAGLL